MGHKSLTVTSNPSKALLQASTNTIRKLVSKCIFCISATRQQFGGEITPVSAVQSSTKDNDNDHHGAALAIDLDMDTQSDTGVVESWIKFDLGQEHCVQKVVMHYTALYQTSLQWTCTQQGCSECEGTFCGFYTLTVSLDGKSSTLRTSDPDCKNGYMVKLEKHYKYMTPYTLSVKEMMIFRKGGKTDS